ncbi:DUF6712 family protein [Pontibacter sp. SGAir0037]|uniref:DUF6712 family protein n=1 Tax=Pontibacter sp. SGAir0037 TaxID=2571030 RepID=UPI0010CCD231|nr:DUF6712 family protein [Pontibacter sp. SGAir0037]QCR23075.1 hypothetical protein C1N53_12455 [Pontibacter sp. SGAir0037]
MPLILTIEEFREHVSVNVATDIQTLQADVLLVEDEQIKKLLGYAFYEELLQKYEEGTLSDLQDKLLKKLQNAIANLAAAEFLPMANVQIDDRGAHVFSTDTEKPAFQWQIKMIQRQLQRKGFNAMERVLEFLEENIDNEDFSAWAESEVSTVYRQYLINRTTEFNEHYSIGNSRLTFLYLLPFLKKMERFSLEPVLGTALFEELQEQIKDKDLTPDNTRLLELFVQPALAHLVVTKALTSGGFAFQGEALLVNLLEDTDSGTKSTAVDNEKRLQAKVQEAWNDGQAYLMKLKEYLNTNASATKYASYYNSNLYVKPGEQLNVVYRNPTNSKTFAAL